MEKVKNKEHIIPSLQRKCGITNFSKTNNPKGLDDYIKKCFFLTKAIGLRTIKNTNLNKIL